MQTGGALVIATRIVEADPASEPRRIAIDVIDSGPGMSAEVAAKAFDPFFTTKPVGQGTGLGLNQVLRFVDEAGGSAAITSRPGEGTTVSLVFPVPAETASLMAA